ncbi:calcitonin gene-related peptide type 1 receptor-like isoform X2 [Acanthaster planci]|uniref:Calcitonin gene-related peptide type 1 receptor-like isoform X2 n=2 Tax=Acanthaster planci TaxID=133434 RepID=A0A8B7XGA8_ACAPL|nr:calcitonin gene-related peptide type 1 receptor-like isoform X2 [Acanthaster planci]
MSRISIFMTGYFNKAPKCSATGDPGRSHVRQSRGTMSQRTCLVFLCFLLLQVASVRGDEEEEANGIFEDQTPEQRAMHYMVYEKCRQRLSVEQPPDDGYTYCNMTFDSWDCWNYTRASETIVQPCPEWIPESDPSNMASKTCMPDGEWFRHPDTNETWTNYTQCREKEDSHNYAYIVYYLGYGLSVLSLCVALFIFFYFRSLACPRVTIHKNLFISFILCGIVWIQWFAAVTQNPGLIVEDPFFCKALLVLGQYFNTCNYFWMLSEGLYLHTVIVVAVFSENHRLIWYYIIGWGLPAIPVFIFTLLMLLFNKSNCWLTDSPFQWCVGGAIILVLIINLCLLLNIVRVLVTKLRATPTSGSGRNYTRAVRATLILLPLLGLHYIILPVRPGGNPTAIDFYDYFMAILLSLQGFFVACIFCFFNGEVMTKIRRRLNNLTLRQTSCSTAGRPRQTKVKMQIRRKWYSYRWGHRGSVFGGRYGNMNTTITETVSTMAPNDRRSVDKGQNSPLLNKAPPPAQNSLGNGKTVRSRRGTTTDTDDAKEREELDSSSRPPTPTQTPPAYAELGPNHSWDCNANTSQNVCPSILIENHDEESKTTEV